jgi:CHAT domain-containing protein
VAPGLSSVHFLVGDWSAARQAAQAGLDASRHLTNHPYYEAQLALQLARLNPEEQGTRAAVLAAVEASWNAEEWKPALEAEAWDLLGEERLDRGDLSGAEAALSEGYRLRALHVKHDLMLSYWRLASLRLAQKRLDEAERLNTQAMTASSGTLIQLSRAMLLHQSGMIHAAQGRTDESLNELEAATERAEHWRTIVPPSAQSSLIAVDSELDHKVYRDFVEKAAHSALHGGDPTWAARAFAAVERNRAGSLRESRGLAEVWREKLPARYWAALSELRRTESQTKQSPEKAEVSKKLHLELTELEAAAGLGYSPNNLESFSTQGSLTLFQRSLRDSELFLSFYTGAAESYLWAVTRSSLHLYRLPAADRIERDVNQFQSAIVGRNAKSESGAALFAALFGKLTQEERSKSSWVLSLDGPLFGLPFAALREGGEYLVERHSLQVTPGAAFLAERATSQMTTFVGVGDPIYNLADERLGLSSWSMRPPAYELPGQLNRLVASGEEVIRSAHSSKQAVVLTGEEAARQRFLDTVRDAHPSTIHLATHVVSESRDQAFLAFSVGQGGAPELLGTSDIAMIHVPNALVVMTGCSSGVGEARAGAGLLGLTRAWLAAGAREVVAAGWPVEDTHGGLLDVFYREVSSVSTAEALRRGQVEMIHSGTWQADPSYWAAFQLTGGVR